MHDNFILELMIIHYNPTFLHCLRPIVLPEHKVPTNIGQIHFVGYKFL